MVGIDRRHLASRKDVVVDHVQRLDGLAQVVGQPRIGRPLARERRGAAFAGHLVGMQDRDVGRHLPEGRVRVPQLVAPLVAGIGIGIGEFGTIVADVSDGAEIGDLAGLAERDMLDLRHAQPARERKVLLVGHVLAGKAQDRIGVDRLPDLGQHGVRQVA